MKKILSLTYILLAIIALVGCAKATSSTTSSQTTKQTTNTPTTSNLTTIGSTTTKEKTTIVTTTEEQVEEHMILNSDGSYGGSLNEELYGKGAPLNGELDHDSIYYLTNDFYNMTSTSERTILPKFKTYQQTMQDSSGIASVLMALAYCGEDVKTSYSEEKLTKMYEEINQTTVYGNGTTAKGLKNLLVNLDYSVKVNTYSDTGSSRGEKVKNCGYWLQLQLDMGYIVLVKSMVDDRCRWTVVMGMDNMSDSVDRDGVVIMADPMDCLDHHQDGYYTEGIAYFWKFWNNTDPSGTVKDQYECILIKKKNAPEIVVTEETRTQTQTVPELHLILNKDGSYGGTRNASLYGTIGEKNGCNDHYDSNYFAFVDYYNLGSTSTRSLLSNYRAFQQTMASSCGLCATMSVLAYYGLDVVNTYDEVWLNDKYLEVSGKTTINNVGTGASNLKKMVATIGFTGGISNYYSSSSYTDRSSMVFPSYGDFLSFVQENLNKGVPIPISWIPCGGHWETIIGIDTMGTDSIYDDVIVLADSHDVSDHYQDGYNTFPAIMFYSRWYNSSYSNNQQYHLFENNLQ